MIEFHILGFQKQINTICYFTGRRESGRLLNSAFEKVVFPLFTCHFSCVSFSFCGFSGVPTNASAPDTLQVIGVRWHAHVDTEKTLISITSGKPHKFIFFPHNLTAGILNEAQGVRENTLICLIM